MSTAVAPPEVKRSGTGNPVRTITRRVVLTGGVLFMLLGLLASYTQVVVISSSGFADHVAASLDHQNVRTALSETIVTRLLQHAPPKVQVAEPILQGAVGTVIGSTKFKAIFRASLYRTHQVLLSRHASKIALNLSKQAALITAVLEARAPKLASKLQAPGAKLRAFSQGNALLPIIQLLQRVRVVVFVAPILSLLCFVIALILATDRRRELRYVGLSIAIPAAVVWLMLALGEWLGPYLVSDPLSQALPGVWEALLGDLRRWSLILVIAGLAVVAIANASSRPPGAQAVARSREWLSGANPSRWRSPVLGLGAVVLGLLVVFDPVALLRLLLVVAGASAVYFGVFAALSGFAPAPVGLSPDSRTLSNQDVGIERWSAVAVVAVAVFLLWVRTVGSA